MNKMKEYSKRLIAALLCMLLPALSACEGSGRAANAADGQADILTQTVIDKNKIPVTVLVKYAFSIDSFEKAAEEKFPQLDIIQVSNYSRDRGMTEYERRLEHDDLADIMMTWPLDVGEEYWADRLLDLSGMSFTSNYTTSMLNTISRDGKLYYLPGPAQVRGIVYNKTLFQEKGWEVPQDYQGFLALCEEIERSGIRPLQLSFANSEVLDTAFDGYGYGESFSTMQDAQALADYNSGKGSFGDYFGEALDTFTEMMQAGIWQRSDLSVTYSDREKLMANRGCAMIEDSVLLCRLLNTKYGSADEYGLMPFFTPGSPSNWARIYMVCFIGLNKHLAEPENQEKYDLVLQLMEYISTPEGQAALAADTGAMFSSVNGVPAPNVEEIDDLRATLEAGRYAIFPELKNAQGALREGLAGLLKGTMTRADIIRSVDQQNLNPAAAQAEEPIGVATEDFTLIQTGSFVTDALRAKAGTDVALFLDAGKDGQDSAHGIAGRFYQGEQTEADALRIIQNAAAGETETMITANITGERLLHVLEYSLSTDQKIVNWFYYFSGLRLEFAPTAEPGNRIRKLTDAEGKPIEPDRSYSVAFMDGSISLDDISARQDSGILITDIVTEAIHEAGTISPVQDDRMKLVAP